MKDFKQERDILDLYLQNTTWVLVSISEKLALLCKETRYFLTRNVMSSSQISTQKSLGERV